MKAIKMKRAASCTATKNIELKDVLNITLESYRDSLISFQQLVRTSPRQIADPFHFQIGQQNILNINVTNN